MPTTLHPVPDVERRRVPKRAYATLRPKRVPALLAHVPDESLGVFAAALYSGMRKGELLGLVQLSESIQSAFDPTLGMRELTYEYRERMLQLQFAVRLDAVPLFPKR